MEPGSTQCESVGCRRPRALEEMCVTLCLSVGFVGSGLKPEGWQHEKALFKDKFYTEAQTYVLPIFFFFLTLLLEHKQNKAH